jgi:hypothetical protein
MGKKQCQSVVTATVAFDSSYPTGGETLTLSKLFLGTLSAITIGSKSGYVFSYDYTNNKILVYGTSTSDPYAGSLQEKANATNLSTLTGVKIQAFGKN